MNQPIIAIMAQYPGLFICSLQTLLNVFLKWTFEVGFRISPFESGYLNSSFVKWLSVENQLGDNWTKNFANPNYFWNNLVS
jgi:hypothetical protein